ncbi:MAG: srkA [Streptosporangiaceae bacterium]|nr:srkA [Streptosporangiaceae bacterium]
MRTNALLSIDVVSDTLRQGYGFAATALTRLGSDIADTFSFEAAGARYVAKFHRIDTVTTLELFDWQGGVQQLLSAAGQPVPSCITAFNGHSAFARDDDQGSVAVQVMGWHAGEPLLQVTTDPPLHRRLGVTAGRFHKALQFAPLPPSLVIHDWDVRRLEERLRDCVSRLPRSRTREICGWALDALELSRTTERLGELPAAIIHQDLNDSNILLTPQREVACILDFGDMTFGPRVAEVAVLAAYVSRRSEDPARAIDEVLGGFISEVAIEEAETEVVVPLVTGRLALNLASNALRLGAGHRAEYANERIAGSLEALERLASSALPSDA